MPISSGMTRCKRHPGNRIRGILQPSPTIETLVRRVQNRLQASLTEGPQLVTMRGKETAVLVPVEEWRRLSERARPGLKELLLAPEPRAEIPIPERGRLRRRSSPASG
ncbi:MAG TPA: type II toxin-antitoxin system prevent-host-death family antitoxin [Woeseiaceae bacterium]